MKKALRPDDKREAVGYLVEEEDLSVRRACAEIQLSFSVYYYNPKPKEADQIIIGELEL